MFSDEDRSDYNKVTMKMSDTIAAQSLNRLCEWLSRYYGKKCNILLGERRRVEELEDTATNALKQIEEKKYDTDLLKRGIPTEHILKYGFTFEGEKFLIQKG